ncbi:blast:Choline-phosphate cytidylyltransferase B [Drosophila guanche]|uniref:Blast:Choline-phosphate cytidylyltransferase B n=1 Tax=Drosophila guanche TaxID=7266 RepID=A0A3B0K046_DROGU|nr:blast:Choline-phosphate cytidylyltransferase B [Drosophila guanche]
MGVGFPSAGAGVGGGVAVMATIDRIHGLQILIVWKRTEWFNFIIYKNKKNKTNKMFEPPFYDFETDQQLEDNSTDSESGQYPTLSLYDLNFDKYPFMNANNVQALEELEACDYTQRITYEMAWSCPTACAGMFVATECTPEVSTSDIVARTVKDYDLFVRRNLARGYTAKELNVSFLSEKKFLLQNKMHELKDRGRRVNVDLLTRWETKSRDLIKAFCRPLAANVCSLSGASRRAR